MCNLNLKESTFYAYFKNLYESTDVLNWREQKLAVFNYYFLVGAFA